MHIQRFNPKTDMDVLNEWLEARGIKPAKEETVPRIGFIAYQEDEPVALCFLRLCEGRFGIVDGLTSNPQLEGSVRHVGLDMVVRAVIAKAEEIGMENLLAWSVDKGTLERAERHGFDAPSYQLLIRALHGHEPFCQ